jgi:predicted nucleic acid-binding protein
VTTYCFDSSAVVKRYAPERGSAWVKSVVQPTAGNSVYLAQIGVVEIAAALSRKVRTHELRRGDYEAALGLFLTDVRNAEFILIPTSDQIIELAVDLTGRHPLRGYDAVHLATAVILNRALHEAGAPPLTFVAADARLCEAAGREGLLSVDPNQH